ncbi:FHA domain-containing protein FhaB/FipA [Corynebacterium caspium]|uniref:FHA domain-containing protein FhaB/FipA n=1 Tax=Corynebacterium caspium TaxID=234828 RepID=UPI00037B7F73|nr:FHA domain-containing protein [Corynebacterium caspium]WKD58479.1 FHA domain-containing protein FhaB [Corynebacterium caspium DSM 44850]
MDAVIITSIRLGLLVLLWVFILFALRALRRDLTPTPGVRNTVASQGAALASPVRSSGGPVSNISVIEGPLLGSHMDMTGLDSVVIGRSQECDFVLGDDFASSRHARLFRRGSDWYVEDLDSRNGTFISGVRIDQPERVGAGSDIRMGRSTVRLGA